VSDAGAFVRVASSVEIPEGELRGYEVPTGRVAIGRVEHEVFALADECPGDGCSLSEGTLDEVHEAVVCACDASAFDVRTGEPVDGPAVDPVAVLRVRVDDDGWVEVGPEIGGRG
jgi:3-phenylpropionate/trans-cinnamate dioxygenase ferredoxin component